jgi:hypothetical protein
MSDKTIYLVMKSWMGGRREIVGAYPDEDSARWAASRLVGMDALIGLETVTLHDSITVGLPDAQKPL